MAFLKKCLMVAFSIADAHVGNLRQQVLHTEPTHNTSNKTAIHEDANSSLVEPVPNFASAEARGLSAFTLGYLGAQCGCMFDTTCTCDTSLTFMNCIAAACESKRCNCDGGMQFLHACHNMSAVCPSVYLHCSHSQATCVTTEWTGLHNQTNNATLSK